MTSTGCRIIMPQPSRVRGILSGDARLTFVWRLSVAYIGPKSRTERPWKTKIGTEVAHVTRDSDTTFTVKMSKVYLQVARAYRGGLPHKSNRSCNHRIRLTSKTVIRLMQ